MAEKIKDPKEVEVSKFEEAKNQLHAFNQKVQLSVITVGIIICLAITLINRVPILGEYLSFIAVKSEEIMVSSIAVIVIALLLFFFKAVMKVVKWILLLLAYLVTCLMKQFMSLDFMKTLRVKAIENSVLSKIEENLKPEVIIEKHELKLAEKQELLTKEPVDHLITKKQNYDKDLEELKSNVLLAFRKYNVHYATITKSQKGPHITTIYLDIGDEKISSLKKIEKEIAIQLKVDSISFLHSSEGLYIEVPNNEDTRQFVTFREVHDEFDLTPHHGFEIPIGKTSKGDLLKLDIRKLPHCLVAGMTGSGKSVFLNVLLCSLIMQNDPNKLKLMLIDPKRVEFSFYKGIPHLLQPVITDMAVADKGLAWLVKEMDRRYSMFESLDVKDIDGFNKLRSSDELPRIVAVIEELADLVMVNDKVDEYMIRISQLARACGIYMVLATQKPVVSVVSTIIKSNLPTRIAFTVKTNSDSRVILDVPGAEKLLFYGDGLLQTPTSQKNKRFQSANIEDGEIKEICDYWKKQRGFKSLSVLDDFVESKGDKKPSAKDLLIRKEIEESKRHDLIVESQAVDDEEHTGGVSLEKEEAEAEAIEEVDVDDDMEDENDPIESFNENEKRVFLYLCKFLYDHECGDEILLPPRNFLREDIGIKQENFVAALKKLEKYNYILKRGPSNKLASYFNYSFDLSEEYILKNDPEYL